MELNLGEKIKALRKARNVSQEKLAKYLNVSFQAVSKWENSSTCPEISLLPEIARFFSITVDELLQAEKFDEEQLFREYEEKAAELWDNRQVRALIPLWEEAYHKMPNHVHVKECLMSAYFDADKVKYQKEIIELGTELYNSDSLGFYKGQAIMEVACTYAENNNMKMAERWTSRAYQLMHSQEMIYMEILTDGKELVEQFAFANYWYFNRLFYMAAKLIRCKDIPGGTAYVQAVNKIVVQIRDILYPDDDMGFEDLRQMCILHRGIAEEETSLDRDENIIKHHLTRAFECARKSLQIKEHDLDHPLLMGWKVYESPSDNKQVMCMLKGELKRSCFDPWRDTEWFAALEKEMEELSY